MVKKIILLGLWMSSIIFANKLTDSIYYMGSASSAAIGLATTAKTNTQDALFFNPAGLNLNTKSSINLSYTSAYNTDFSNISYIAKSDILSFGAGMHISQSPDIDKTSFNDSTNQITIDGQYRYTYSSLFLSGSIQIPYLSFGYIGSSIHFHRMRIENDILTGKTVNIGLLFKPFQRISIGYTQHNVIPLHLTWLSKNKINTQEITTIHTIDSYGILGIEITALKTRTMSWRILSDYALETIQNNGNNPSPIKIGTEFEVSPITIKAGHNDRFLSIGISTKLKQIQFNYSFILPKEKNMLDNRHAFGLNYFL